MSGPITLFDKSFIQSLSVDESVWFDNFFMAVICPIFYAETLADLSKDIKGSHSPQQEVEKIAMKFPDMSGTPCLRHTDLCIGNLLGNRVSMDGRIMVPGGQPVNDRGKTGIVFDSFPEVEAFNRWQQGQFTYVEDNFAKDWRDSVTNLNLKKQAELFRSIGLDNNSCKSLEGAKKIANNFVNQTKPFDQMSLAVLFLNIPRQYHEDVLKNWQLQNYPPISKFAPYAAYVLEIELFFQIAIAAHLISSDRPSNRIDISYLFYLPFSMIFVSSDKLHRKCAKYFLRENQEFIWGQDLKLDLANLNMMYKKLPEEVTELGVISFAHSPPHDGDFLTTMLWDRHMSKTWREMDEISTKMPEKNEKLVEMINEIKDSPKIISDDVNYDDINSMTLKRMIRKQKGNWLQVHKDIEHGEQ